jgi:predicted ester cyclase
VSEAGEKNKALVRRFTEAFAKGDLDTLDELLASDFVDHSMQLGQEPGREGYMQGVAEDQAAFTGTSITIEYQSGDGDMVISRFAIRGIHDRGEYLSVAPTGREWETSAIVIHRIARGKIAEEWSESSGTLEATRQSLAQERIERERIEQELQVARRIQRASLPEEVPILEGWQISPFYRPAREVGGDFYEFFELPHGHLGLVVGDATDKGVPAALVASTTCGMLEAVAPSSGSPSETLERVNEALLARIPSNMFVTCF